MKSECVYMYVPSHDVHLKLTTLLIGLQFKMFFGVKKNKKLNLRKVVQRDLQMDTCSRPNSDKASGERVSSRLGLQRARAEPQRSLAATGEFPNFPC